MVSIFRLSLQEAYMQDEVPLALPRQQHPEPDNSRNRPPNRLLRRTPLFDSLLSLHKHEPHDDYELAPMGENTYELEVGGRKSHLSDSGLIELNARPAKDGWDSRIIAILNFTNSIVGAGLMTLPYAMMRSGLLLGLVLLVLITLVVNWSVMLLIRCGRLACSNSYTDLMRISFGEAGAVLCSMFQVIFSLGEMCAYLIVMADNMTRVLNNHVPDSILADRTVVTVVATALVIFPLSLTRNLHFLANFSFLALIAMVFIILVVVWEAPALLSKSSIKWVGDGFAESLGIFSFAFVCHHNSFEIHDSLDIPSISTFEKVTHYSTGISLITSLMLTVPAYLCFTDTTEANILNNFGRGSLLINASRVLLAITSIFTYPLDCYVAREVVSETVFGRKPPSWAHLALTSLLVGLTLVISLGHTNLEMILELTGGLAASALAFIFPAGCYLKLIARDPFACDKATQRFARVLLAFGIFVLFTSTSVTIYRAL